MDKAVVAQGIDNIFALAGLDRPDISNNESAVRELGDDTLKKIALEITEKLRRSTTVDWQKRESVRAVRRVFLAGGSGLCPCLCPFLEYLYCGTPLDRRS